jgi:hypothetical protein
MALSVAAGAKPAFFSKNWINQDSIDYGTFTASEMQALLSRVIDGDPLSYWHDSSATDGTEVTLTFSLQDLGLLASRAVDLVLFQNINWKNFVAEYSTDGGANYTPFSGGNYASGLSPAVAYASSDLQLALPAQVTGVQYIRVRITHTQTANQAKKLGGVVAAALVLQASVGDGSMADEHREVTDVVILGNGNETHDYTMRSAQSYIWWGRSVLFRGLTKTEVDTLYAVKVGGEPFVYYPRPGDDVRAAYLCLMSADGWKPKPLSKYLAAGYDLALSLREVRESA